MIETRYKTIWKRICASIVDTIVLLPITLGSTWTMKHHASLPAGILVLIYLLSCLAGFVYIIGLLGKYGQTLGKMALHVIVMDIGERVHINYFQAFKRNLVSLILTAIPMSYQIVQILSGTFTLSSVDGTPAHFDLVMLLINFIWFLAEITSVLATSKRRAIHDFIAGSVVVRK